MWLDYETWQQLLETVVEIRKDIIELKKKINEYKETPTEVKEDVKEEKEDIKEYANTITTTVEGFLGCPIGSVFTFNEELGIWEHNWSNENVTRNVSFSANLFDRNSKFFKILSWGE